MTEWKPKILLQSYIVFIISAIAPSVMIWILYGQIFGSSQVLTYGSYRYPHWANLIGWSLASVSIAVIPIMTMHELFRTIFRARSEKTLRNRLTKPFHPTGKWWTNYQRSLNEKKIDLMIQSGTDND